MADTSLINLGELSKPATVLIEKISGAVGILYDPTRIRREARAKADAALIEASAVIEIGELERRAMGRFVQEQSREQANIENITAKALPNISESSDPSQVDDDWLAEFFARSRRVSNEEMQDLWSRMLSGEANNPGSVSKRTLDFVGLMDRSDAELFSRLCNFSATSIGEALIFDTSDELLAKESLQYSDLAHLESIGLIQLADGMSSFIRQGMEESFNIEVSSQILSVKIEEKENDVRSFEFGKVMFTRTGRELRKFVQIIPPSGFYDYCIGFWHKKNYCLSSPYPRRIR